MRHVSTVERQKRLLQRTEQYIEQVGPFRWFQYGFMFTCQLIAVFIGVHYFGMAFFILDPTIKCNDHESLKHASSHMSQNLSSVIISDKNDLSEAQKTCQVVDNCQNYTFNGPWGFNSIPTEWSYLIEERCGAKGVYNQLFLVLTLGEFLCGIAFVIGGILGGIVGRKPVVLVSIILGTISSFLLAFSKNLLMFVILFCITRCLVVQGWVANSLLSEYTLNKYRLAMNYSQDWSIAIIIFGALGYFARDWRLYIRICSALGVPIAILLMIYPESPRWLITERKYDRAASALNRMAFMNGRKSQTKFTGENLRKELSDLHDDEIENNPGPLTSLKHWPKIFTEKKLLLITLVSVFQLFMIGAVHSAFFYNLGSLITNPYLSIVLIGVFRVWCPFFTVAIDRLVPNFKRKRMLLLSYFICLVPTAIATICMIVLSTKTDTNSKGLELAASITTIIGATLNYGIVYYAFYQIQAEVYPTVVRSAALPTTNFFATIGLAVGPHFHKLGDYWSPLHYVVLLGLYLICAGFNLAVLPETKAKPLPDSFEDFELMTK